MKAASIKELKTELSHCDTAELLTLCLRLAKFKKENKELLTYLLFESTNEEGYIEKVKEEIDNLFGAINTSRHYYIKKGFRKILREIKKYARYSSKKETETELLIYFCTLAKEMNPPIKRNSTLKNIYTKQLEMLKKQISGLHEDLQYDYNRELEGLLL